MTIHLKSVLASAALALAACIATPTLAADLGGYQGGSIKDTYVAAPAGVSAGPCYLRSDIGYSWSNAPSSQYVGNVDPTMWAQSLDNSVVLEGGIGCGSGSRGFRGEVMLGRHGDQDFKADYTKFMPSAPPVDPQLSTTVKTYTLMSNVYYDLGNMRGFVPYIGAGVGLAYHKMSALSFDTCGGCSQFGEDKVSVAWALMAGVGYQITDRMIVDLGYRYIDLGSARSSHADSSNSWNPRLEINDMHAHEFKVGMRYHLGSADCCTGAAYAPMK